MKHIYFVWTVTNIVQYSQQLMTGTIYIPVFFLEVDFE